MQTPKAKIGSLEVTQRKSPATPRTARKLKTPGSESDSIPSPNPANRTPKDRSPIVTERKSHRSPVTEKKRLSRVSELESQLAQLQDDLKKAKDQLNTSELWKRRAQQEAEDSKKQLLDMSSQFEESQQQLLEVTASEDARLQELRKISHDRDKAWESELEAVQKQQSMDSAALASAMNEIQKLKNQLEMVTESEASQSKHAESAHAELQSLRIELTETLNLVEKLKNELNHWREAEAEAQEIVSKTQDQLEEANTAAEMLRSDHIKAVEAYNSLSLELEQSKAQIKSLEEVVNKLQSDEANGCKTSVNTTQGMENVRENGGNEEAKQLKEELKLLKFEMGQFKSALEMSETRYQQEYIQSTLQIRSAYEQIEQTKFESGQRESELQAELKKAKDNIEELRVELQDKEKELQSVSEENKGLNLKIEKNHPGEVKDGLEMKLEHELEELKSSLLDKDSELQNVTQQNEILKTEIQKAVTERSKVNDEAVGLAETARAAEREALMKLGYLTEEADKNSRRAERVAEQLDAAQATNTELEAELRKLKVQADQWRKAAEAAASMLSTGNTGKLVDRAVSLDNNYNTIARTMGSPYSEEMDDDSPKKKNVNMLKKIGVLWKKGQK
ncbi:hypothetical protein K2173_019489 [Erythroxylum novogranatense]|uniref:Interactor of constitutive active ROPs 2, chloroplastic n=1 Tax=Erythroxylum novogranatense TaxID=1862640 RepID=A0AAV8UBH6_9ROSI|nr:hypothetical protein K2173_019489 [Erythroxylum novogranatense]